MNKLREWKALVVRFTTEITREQFLFLAVCLLTILLAFYGGLSKEPEIKVTEPIKEPVAEITATPTPTPIPTAIIRAIEPTKAPEPIPTQAPVNEAYIDTEDATYPYNTIDAEWGAELYESGFSYYEIPEKYAKWGACFPEVVQAYLWDLCEQREIDYYIALAVIEVESNYFWNVIGDGGASTGYMQVQEKWHKERMEAEGVEDLLNPYGNIRVGLNYLQDISNRAYGDWHYILMSYNMGEDECIRYYNNGIYSTAYSRLVLKRAQEIKQELQQEVQDYTG